MKRSLPLMFSLASSVAFSTCAAEKPGYKDTPFIPGMKWQVHDSDRPHPSIVTPGAAFSHMAPPPSDATVLFNGKDLSKWRSGSGAADWKIEDGYMEVTHDTIQTKDRFADFQLHLEFATPAKVAGNSQERGNSGVLFNGVYEVQVLDSYNNVTYADGQCGALYGQTPPLVNACKPPGEWQTYDIVFESPRWDADGKLVKKANVTVLQNGVLLHLKREFLGTTPHHAVGNYDRPHPPEVFIQLQDHHNPMRYRNIWVRPIGRYDSAEASQG